MRHTQPSHYSAQLFKADRRSSEETSTHKSQRVLSAGASRQAFDDLLFLNDIFIKPGQSFSCTFDEAVQHLLIPLVGTLSYSNKIIREAYVASEELVFLNGESSQPYLIKNPYPDQTINYLHIGLNKEGAALNSPSRFSVNFRDHNALASLGLNKMRKASFGYAGVYQGRAKGGYTLQNKSNGAFVYIINGAFEVEERLMEHRDALVLWNIERIEFEALSEFAILLVLEVPLSNKHTNN